MTDLHRLLTTAEVALTLRVSSETVRRLVNEGKLGSVRIGHVIRIPSDELDRLLTEAVQGPLK